MEHSGGIVGKLVSERGNLRKIAADGVRVSNPERHGYEGNLTRNPGIERGLPNPQPIHERSRGTGTKEFGVGGEESGILGVIGGRGGESTIENQKRGEGHEPRHKSDTSGSSSEEYASAREERESEEEDYEREGTSRWRIKAAMQYVS